MALHGFRGMEIFSRFCSRTRYSGVLSDRFMGGWAPVWGPLVSHPLFSFSLFSPPSSLPCPAFLPCLCRRPCSAACPALPRRPRSCPAGCPDPARERGPWHSTHARGTRAARRRGDSAQRPAGVGGQEASGGWVCAHQLSKGAAKLTGQAQRGEPRRGDDVQWQWRWSSAEEDLRKGNRPGEDRNRSRRGRVSSLRKELKGASSETTDRGRPTVGKKVAPPQLVRSWSETARRLLSATACCPRQHPSPARTRRWGSKPRRLTPLSTCMRAPPPPQSHPTAIRSNSPKPPHPLPITHAWSFLVASLSSSLTHPGLPCAEPPPTAHPPTAAAMDEPPSSLPATCSPCA
ncbi:hypothetical protein PVAP13_6NG247603 [Panicum virgatum]|uniref:Uncharacterized protein n=1 Tax=Panicum virgatum TaxID=38727 RepID=A0A8T0R2D7_PANVG|nr:hypothetical protein PVAP13_6NG247603 [Panicum virgatum]